jgi:hypothetical protein
LAKQEKVTRSPEGERKLCLSKEEDKEQGTGFRLDWRAPGARSRWNNEQEKASAAPRQ